MDEDKLRAAVTDALETWQPGFGTFFLARLFGLEISYPAETCVVEFSVADWMFNPQGTLHGGVICVVLDISMGHLLKHTGAAGTTLEIKTQYLSAATAGKLRATGRFLRRGRSISFLESRMADAEGRAIAVASSTWRLLSQDV